MQALWLLCSLESLSLASSPYFSQVSSSSVFDNLFRSVPTSCPDPPKLENGKYQLGVPSTFYAYGKYNDTVGIINPTGEA